MRRLQFLVGIVAAGLMAGCSSGPSSEAKKEEAPAAPAAFKVDPATAGKVSGKILFTGTKPVRTAIKMSGEEAECAKLHKTPMLTEEVVVNPDGTLANVFVYVKSGLEGKTFEPPAESVKIDQNGCRFAPHVMGIQTGQTLEVVNSDPFSHNIHPLPQNNREWNQQQAPGTPNLERTFARSEVMVPVKCNIHSWMRAYIGVLDHPYFAVSGDSGMFEIANLPPGEYTIGAWHETLGEQERKVTVPASGAATADFTFAGK